MLNPSSLFRHSFQATGLWVPALRFSSPVVRHRRYKVFHENGALTIQRTWNDCLDSVGLEQAKRWFIAKGTIKWVGGKTDIDLVIALNKAPRVVFGAMLIAYLIFTVLIFIAYWKFGMISFVVFTLIVLGKRAYLKFALAALMDEFESDITHFNVDESTRWHETHA